MTGVTKTMSQISPLSTSEEATMIETKRRTDKYVSPRQCSTVRVALATTRLHWGGKQGPLFAVSQRPLRLHQGHPLALLKLSLREDGLYFFPKFISVHRT